MPLPSVVVVASVFPVLEPVRMTVARCRGVRVALAGWANPITSRARAARRAPAGMWRCQPDRRGATDASMPTLVKRTTSLRRARWTKR